MHDPLSRTQRRSIRRRWQPLAIGTLAVALMIQAAAASAASAPGYLTDPDAAPGTYSEQNLGADRTSSSFFYRIPALAHLGDGVILAAWDARPGSAADAPNPNSIIQRRSTDNGQTWSDLEIIAAGQAAGPKYGYSDPSYVVDRETGTVFAFFVYSKDQSFQGSAYGNDDEDRQVISAAVIESDDQGVTWSEPRLITDVVKPAEGTTAADGTYTPVAGDVKGVFATSGEGIQLQYGAYAGRLIQQYAGTVLQSNGTTTIQAYSVYSDDHGQTWQRGQYVGTGMDENKTVELSDGRVMLNSRDSAGGGQRKVAISTDGGATYGEVTRDAELPDPTNNASITRLHPDAAEGTADAQKLVFTNANSTTSRANGVVRLSCDDGETWPGARTIETGTFAYSSATALDDGRIGVLWEAGYTNTMQFSSFDEDWINAACAPLTVGETALEPGIATSVPVTVTNQEDAALSGVVSFYTTDGWQASSAAVSDLLPGESTTVDVVVTAPDGAEGKVALQASFTASDGRVSQTTATMQLPLHARLGATLTATMTSASRDVIANPYAVGDQLSFQVRVVSTANIVTTMTPAANTFSSGFAPTACRWQNLAAAGAYNCSTPKRTLTQEDIDRGWYAPEFAFTVTAVDGSLDPVVVEYSGAAVLLRDGVLDAAISGARSDTARDLAVDPYAVGEPVPYAFRVDNAAPTVVTVTPVSGAFAPFIPPGAGNCRFSNLAVGAGYDCTTARHIVTAEDLARGYFDADTTWTVAASGQTARTIEVTGGEVDVVARDPRLKVSTTGTWQDADGDGIAEAGESVTWTTTATNTGNVALDDVSVGGVELGALAAGASVELDAVVVGLTAAEAASGTLDAPEIAAGAVNGARSAVVVTERGAVALPAAATWVSTAVYTAGDRVLSEGGLWEAGWWTQAQRPGADVYGPWQEIAVDASGATAWTASRVFTAGAEVVHDGVSYTALWWTRNQEPGTGAFGPWAAR